MSNEVSVQVHRGVGRITLTRPKALHALNAPMCETILAALERWAGDPTVHLVMIDHEEETRGFCAGGDIRMLAESGAGDAQEARAFFNVEYRMNAALKTFPKPVLAIMDGVTMGGGVGLSVHGSHRIATERTLFAMPETGIGLFPDVGGGWFLPRLPGATGMWLALTGARLKGEDVLAVGVATHFADEPAGLAGKLCEQGVSALDSLKTKAEPSFAEHQGEIDACFGKDSVEGIVSALKAGSGWAQSQAETLASKSPLTMKIAHRQLTEGGKMSDFRDNMRMEYRIGGRLVCTENFIEGVRAVLVDKDHNPNWEPPTLEAVSDDLVDSFFAPLGENELQFI